MKSVKIGEMTLEVPIIQGGMGVGISLGNLAGNVALNGGMGVISTAQPGYRAADFEKNTVEANRRELASEIQKAKEIAKGKGIVAINAMVALTDYAGMVEVAVKNKIDAIISGAGLPLNLPGLVKDTKIKLAPIVSSGKAAKLICKTWDRKFKVAPDFIVIEGSEAGGHLGFHKEDVLNKTTAKLADIFKEVKETLGLTDAAIAKIKAFSSENGSATYLKILNLLFETDFMSELIHSLDSFAYTTQKYSNFVTLDFDYRQEDKEIVGLISKWKLEKSVSKAIDKIVKLLEDSEELKLPVEE